MSRDAGDDNKIGSKVNKAANKLSSKADRTANKLGSKADKFTSKAKQATSKSGTTGRNKQRAVLPPNAPRNQKENSESVVLFVAVASLFLTGAQWDPQVSAVGWQDLPFTLP